MASLAAIVYTRVFVPIAVTVTGHNWVSPSGTSEDDKLSPINLPKRFPFSLS